jgi:hypothetical protein
MPPAFNLSQDQTLQFNLCFVPSLAGSALTRKPSLTQNTDSCVLANLSVFLLREHLLYHLSIPAYQVRRRTPSSAHTYRLLVFKELQIRSASTADGPGLRSVVFVSSREMRLCDVSCKTSIDISGKHVYLFHTTKLDKKQS